MAVISLGTGIYAIKAVFFLFFVFFWGVGVWFTAYHRFIIEREALHRPESISSTVDVFEYHKRLSPHL